MIEKWRRNLDEGGICGALFTDLSKTFDCLVHDFLLAKLEDYGFTYKFLKLINSFLTGRKHRTKVNSSYISFLDLLIGVPQGSILGVHSYLIYTYLTFSCFLMTITRQATLMIQHHTL